MYGGILTLYCNAKHHELKQLGEERVYLILQVTVHHKGISEQKIRYKLRQR